MEVYLCGIVETLCMTSSTYGKVLIVIPVFNFGLPSELRVALLAFDRLFGLEFWKNCAIVITFCDLAPEKIYKQTYQRMAKAIYEISRIRLPGFFSGKDWQKTVIETHKTTLYEKLHQSHQNNEIFKLETFMKINPTSDWSLKLANKVSNAYKVNEKEGENMVRIMIKKLYPEIRREFRPEIQPLSELFIKLPKPVFSEKDIWELINNTSITKIEKFCILLESAILSCRYDMFEQSIAFLKQIQKVLPRNEFVNEIIASIYIRWSIIKNDKNIVNDAINQECQDLDGYIVRALLSGKRYCATKFWKKVIEIYPHPKYYFILGSIYEFHFDFISSLECYRAAYNIWPSHKNYQALNQMQCLKNKAVSNGWIHTDNLPVRCWRSENYFYYLWTLDLSRFQDKEKVVVHRMDFQYVKNMTYYLSSQDQKKLSVAIEKMRPGQKDDENGARNSCNNYTIPNGKEILPNLDIKYDDTNKHFTSLIQLSQGLQRGILFAERGLFFETKSFHEEYFRFDKYFKSIADLKRKFHERKSRLPKTKFYQDICEKMEFATSPIEIENLINIIIGKNPVLVPPDPKSESFFDGSTILTNANAGEKELNYNAINYLMKVVTIIQDSFDEKYQTIPLSKDFIPILLNYLKREIIPKLKYNESIKNLCKEFESCKEIKKIGELIEEIIEISSVLYQASKKNISDENSDIEDEMD